MVCVGVGGEYPLTASGAAEDAAISEDEALLDDFEKHQLRLRMVCMME